jgi:GTP-binding protein EngB required for normal cell division
LNHQLISVSIDFTFCIEAFHNFDLFPLKKLVIGFEMTETGPAMKCKIVFLGDQSVGKTSIINRFIFDNFTGNEQVPTV